MNILSETFLWRFRAVVTLNISALSDGVALQQRGFDHHNTIGCGDRPATLT